MNDFDVEKITIEKDKENNTLQETIKHADKIIENSEKANIIPNIISIQTINLQNASLFDIDKNIIPKISSFKPKKLNDTMFDLVLEYDKNQENIQSRKLEKKAGSIVTSILMTTITVAIGIIAALVFLK